MTHAHGTNCLFSKRNTKWHSKIFPRRIAPVPLNFRLFGGIIRVRKFWIISHFTNLSWWHIIFSNVSQYIHSGKTHKYKFLRKNNYISKIYNSVWELYNVENWPTQVTKTWYNSTRHLLTHYNWWDIIILSIFLGP